MPLNKQKVQLAISGGLDTKTDDKNVLATNFLELENCVFTETGSLTKRNGNEILETRIVGGGTLESGKGLATLKEELLHFDGKKLYSYVDDTNQWVEKGSVVSVITETSPIINNSFQQTDADYGVIGNMEVYAWNDSRGGARYSVVDRVTQNFVVSDVELDPNGADCKILRNGASLLLLYRVGVALFYRSINPTNPTLLPPPVQVVNNMDTAFIYDAVSAGVRVFIAWKNSVGGTSVRYIDSDFTQSGERRTAGELPENSITVLTNSVDAVQVVYGTSTELRWYVHDYDLTNYVLSPTTAATQAGILHVTAYETSDAVQTVLYEIDGGASDNYIQKLTISNAGVATTPEQFQRSVGLYSKIFNNGSDNYVVTAFDSDLQASYFVFTLDGDLVGTIVPQNGGGYKQGPNLTEVSDSDTGVYKFAVLKKHTLVSGNDSIYSLTGVQGATLDFQSTNHYLNAELGDNLHIVGGVLQMYDGSNVVEHGFAYFPEDVQVTLAGGGNLEAGSYQYVAVYAWTDNYGQLHRSAPSIPVTVVATPSQSAEIEVSTLRVTKKENAIIEIYGTEADRNIFYKLTETDNPLYNDKTVDSVTFTDTDTDTGKLDGEILYITGGVLDNIAPGANSLITTYKSRIILGGLEDENKIQYSKERVDGRPVEFSDALTISVDARGGKMKALANLDNYVVIFKKRAIFAFSGEGPNNLGEQNDFRIPQLITTDAGCVDSNSVVETPMGLMFKSDKGIYLLDRGLQVTYIGAPVEKFNEFEITSATLLATTNQVRFTTADSLTMVFDYFHNRWSTFTNHRSQDADIYRNKFVMIRDTGEVYLETPGQYVDGTQPIKTKIVSSWMQMAGVQGFQRFYKLMLLGNFKSDHQLKIQIGYDFNPAFIQGTQIEAGDILTQPVYGETSPFGADELYGGEAPLYQWQIFPKIQKCQAFRFKIEDFQLTTLGEAFSISNMAMIIGTKVGLNKKSDSFGFGTSTGG